MVFLCVVADVNICPLCTGRLCGTSEISHHAVGGSAASMSELSLVLQERAASALPELCTQVDFI